MKILRKDDQNKLLDLVVECCRILGKTDIDGFSFANMIRILSEMAYSIDGLKGIDYVLSEMDKYIKKKEGETK